MERKLRAVPACKICNKLIPFHKWLSRNKEQGFTLLEVILVLAVIGTLATVILPNLNLSIDSKIHVSLRTLTTQIRATYDDSVFTHRLHRMVLNIKTGEYWVEIAPVGFQGRPPFSQAKEEEDILLRDNKKSLYESFEDSAKIALKRESPLSTLNDHIYYTVRSIPVVQRNALVSQGWPTVNDAIISKQKLANGVIFSKFTSEVIDKPIEHDSLSLKKDDDTHNFAYIYFLPDGTISSASLWLTIKNKDGRILDEAPKYTLSLNTLTGQSHLVEGFVNVDFH